MATYIVGDIQACLTGLKKLLAKVDFCPATDTLWAVGDLIGRGKEPLETVAFLYSLDDSFHAVLGNHDLHFLAVQQGIKPVKKADNLTPLLNSDEIAKYTGWLRSMPLAAKADDTTLLTHAGLYPQWSFAHALSLSDEVAALLKGPTWRSMLEAMYSSTPQHWSNELQGPRRIQFIVNAFTRMRFLTIEKQLNFSLKSAPDTAPAHLFPWFAFDNLHLTHEQKVVFGHWASLMGHTQRRQFIGLDTGYVWGNAMTLLHLQSGEKISVEY